MMIEKSKGNLRTGLGTEVKGENINHASATEVSEEPGESKIN